MSRWRRYPKYKPSGVEWLGEVPEGWEILPLKRLLQRNDSGVWGDDPRGFNDTIVLRSTEQTVDGKWIISEPAKRSLSLKDRHDCKLMKGDLVITKSSGSEHHIGKTTIVDDNIEDLGACFSNFMQRIRCDDGLLPFFIYYFLNSSISREQVSFFSTTTTGLANLNREIINNIIFALPFPPEQSAIATFLDVETVFIETLIIKKEQQIALLNEKRAALISHILIRGLDTNAKMKDSKIEWIGEVPAHWKIEKLKQLSPRISGRLVFKPARYFSGTGMPFLFGTNVTENGFVLHDVKYIPLEINERFKHHALKTDDLVMVRVGAPGLTAVIPKELEGLNCASMIIIRKSPLFIAEWLSFVLNSQIGKTQVDSVTYGAAQEQINVSDAINFVIPTPPLYEQKQIMIHLKEISENYHQMITQINKSIALLQEYRSALISAAVTGKIDVRIEAR